MTTERELKEKFDEQREESPSKCIEEILCSFLFEPKARQKAKEQKTRNVVRDQFIYCE